MFETYPNVPGTRPGRFGTTTPRASVLQVYSAVVLILGIVLLAGASSRSWIYLEHDLDSSYEVSLELGPRGALACHGGDCETSIWNNMDVFFERHSFEAFSQKPHFVLAAVAWGVFGGGVVCGIWMIALGVFGAPSYVIDGEIFWGQDRLDFVERKLRA